MKEETIITTCPYCGADASNEKLLVRLGGKVYRQCAECKTPPITIFGYLFGTLFYDVPFMVLGALTIWFTHFVAFANINDALRTPFEYMIFGTMSLALPLAFSWFSGLPIFLTPLVLCALSWYVIGL